MTSMTHQMPAARRGGFLAPLRLSIALAEQIPLFLVQLAGRVAVAHVFWQSAQTKLASWQVTQQLFAYEYQLPVLDPASAALLATAAELGGAVLLFLGLFARLGALVLLGVTATIQFLVFPGHWPEHLMWASMLLLILARGAGTISIDHVARRVLVRGA